MLKSMGNYFAQYCSASGINFVQYLFLSMALYVIIFGILVNYFEHYLSDSVKQMFRFGKLAFTGKQNKWISMLEIPKSSFRHYYIFSSILLSCALLLVLSIYQFEKPIPDEFLEMLNCLGGDFRVATVTQSQTVLALVLLTVQCYRRLYDTHFVSVFSAKSKINLSHYFVGFIHYTGCALAILMEAPRFAKGCNTEFTLVDNGLGYLELLAMHAFLIACYQQYRSTVILANLRKDANGHVISESHTLPKGEMFEYFSSPHMICEIIMYASLTVILRHNHTWFAIFVWVFTNQIEVILLNHWWYQANIKEFPSQRKALIPFVY